MTRIKLSEWAKTNNYSYKGAYRLWKSGRFPLKTIQLETGTILVEQELKSAIKNTVIYCRVSSHDQKSDLDRQEERLKVFASSQGYIVQKTFKEIGSGLNGKRNKLLSILKDSTIEDLLTFLDKIPFLNKNLRNI